MKKYVHQFLISFAGDPANVGYIVEVFSNNRAPSYSEVTERIRNDWKDKKSTFGFKSQVVFLNK